MADRATTASAKGDEGGMGYLQSVPRRVITIYLPLAIFVFVLLFPFYWMAVTAVKPNEEMTNFNDFSPFWVVNPTLEHIRYLLFQTSYPGWLLNTVIISTAATFLSLLAAVFAAAVLAGPALADEAVVVTQHHYSAGGVSLNYRAETGRLPIFDPATGKAADILA